MDLAVAPRQLPFAPRPIATELLSSWLLRVAAANFVSLAELLEGFEGRYGSVLPDSPIDYALSDAATTALSQFCRVTPNRIRPLDLWQRAPQLNSKLLLRFQDTSPVDPRRCWRRVRYAFCRLCIAEQQLISVRWDWSVACLLGCAVHGVPLLDGCPACHEPDPLIFSGFEVFPNRCCRSCGNDLTGDASPSAPGSVYDKGELQIIQDTYRAAILGVAPHPKLLGKTTDGAFRRFVEDMLHLLTDSLAPDWATIPAPFSRQDIVHIISALILNAAPSSNDSSRSNRYTRGLALWGTLLSIIPQHHEAFVEQASLRWPLPLRRRFVSALYYRKRKRWPDSPYRPLTVGKRLKRIEIASIYGLLPTLPISTIF